jgi:hypothetical protein
MQSKKFRNQQFCKGDLVAPNWRPTQYHGCGLVLNIEHNRWDEKSITVYWQGMFSSKEAPVDLVLLEQVLD